jgi:hypothetical protein
MYSAYHNGYPKNTWFFIAGTFDGTTINVYLNGTPGNPSPFSGTEASTSGTGYVGDLPGCSYYLDGGMANVQLYNASLSQAEITALYDEGIGGAPIRVQNLVGWWPLNGNLNDYSGNDNNGQMEGQFSFNGSYQGSYQGAYTPP